MSKLIQKRETTEDDFSLFITLCNKYISWLGIHNWSFEYVHGCVGRNSDGECHNDFDGKKVTLGLGKKIDEGRNIYFIAKHEVSEALLANLDWASKQWIAKPIVDEYRHEVINHIVRLLTLLEEACGEKQQ